MTKLEVLKELEALNELTNSIGRAMIVNVRGWIEGQEEPHVHEPAAQEEQPEPDYSVTQGSPFVAQKPVLVMDPAIEEKPKPFKAHTRVVKKLIKKR